MFDIPHEIWMHITSFLSNNEIWALRFLNSSLREIAMNNKYKTLRFTMSSSGSKGYIRDFVRFFRDEYIAKRIRRISYVTYVVGPFPKQPRPTRLGVIKGRLKNLFSDDNKENDLLKTMKGFNHLTSFEILCPSTSEKDLLGCIPLFHAHFQMCFSHLQSLYFHFPIKYVSSVIPADLFLPHLRLFSVGYTYKAIDDPNTSFEETAMSTIVLFLNRHRRTITALDLTLDKPTDATSLFQGIDHITSLQSVIVSMTPLTKPSSLARFLELHRQHLKKIYIITVCQSTSITSIDAIFGIISLPFPELKHFIIHFPLYVPIYSPPFETILPGPMANFIKKCSSSLMSLEIPPIRQTQESLFALLHTKNGTDVSFSQLRYLYVTVLFLTPDVMDFLSSQLPNLNTLKLCALTIKSRKHIPDFFKNEHQFCIEIGESDYSDWKLEHLSVLLQRSSSFTRTTLGRFAIARAIPSLKTLNDAPLVENICFG